MEVSGKGLVTPWVRLPLSSDASGPGQDFHKTGQTVWIMEHTTGMRVKE